MCLRFCCHLNALLDSVQLADTRPCMIEYEHTTSKAAGAHVCIICKTAAAQSEVLECR